MPSKQQKKRDAQREIYLSNIQCANADGNQIIELNEESNSTSTQFATLTMAEHSTCSQIPSTERSGGRPRKRQVSNHCNETPKRVGGRPKKRKAGPGRGHRSSSSSCQNSPAPVLGLSYLPLNEDMLLTDSEPLMLHEGPVMSSDGHVAQPELFESRNELLNLWNNQNEMCDDRIIYAYLRYLASINIFKRVAVVAPFYTNPNVHYGPGAINLDLNNYCYNHTPDYDILLVPVCFPGHFTLLIYDRIQREDPQCLFIDSLPPAHNITADFVDRLRDTRFPGYDENRIILLRQTICQLTPDLAPNDINIQIVEPAAYTCQTDGISCGFFTILYAESYLMNDCCLLLQNLDINAERKRILSQLSFLLLTDAVPYIPRNAIQQSNSELTTDFFQNNIRPCNQMNGRSRESSLHSYTSSRRSSRIASRNSSRETSVDSTSTALIDSNPITERCYLRHRDYPCADVRSMHTPVYYDSGNLGDKKCEYCSAMLLNSEATTKKRKTSSWYCCKFGKVRLPEITEPPVEMLQLATDMTPEAKEYRKHQNAYNSLLAFASVSVGHQENTMDGGVCFMLNGEFVRKISSLFAGNFTPSFTQLFILDPEAAMEHRMQNTSYGGNRVNQATLKKMDLLLRQHHPLAKQLLNFHDQYIKALQAGGPDAVQNFRLTLLEARIMPNEQRDITLHPRQTNLPTEGTLFSVWTESERPPVQHGIWISTAQGELRKIQPYHPLTDTLCYPLIIPFGDDGYHKKLTVNTSKKTRRGILTEENDIGDNEAECWDDENQMDVSECETMSNNETNLSNISLDELSDDDDSENNKPMRLREYVRYRTAIRGQNYHHIWSAAGGLSQKLILDYAARIDADVANYLRRPELNLRGTLPEHLLRWFARNAGLTSPEEIGSVVLFRKFHPGTRAYFQEMYYNATTLMARTRNPRNACFMFTWTCNPRWPEIQRNFLQNDQKVTDRFDILCRVYEDKLRYIHYLMDKKKIFGKQVGFAESREFQKRAGGPHLHRIFQSDIPAVSEAVDNLIWAHIPAKPNENDQSGWANFIRKIRVLLPKYQLHDCGAHCLNAQGRCSKGFPKPFSKHTTLFDDKPAQYKRLSPQDGGETLKVKKGRIEIIYDNSRVVPYNPFILALFETHHNLEYAYGQSTNLKYALKYPFKGASFSYLRCALGNKTTVDEPAYYARMLYRSPVEAFSRLMSFRYAVMSHNVINLSIHLPGQQKIYTRPGLEAQQVAELILNGQLELPDTPLSAYWKQWRADSSVKNILFENMPEKFSFDKKNKVWKPRIMSKDPKRLANRRPCIGRIYPILPRAQEKFALYLLTRHFPGDPDHLKKVGDYQCDTFLQAARRRGLIKDSDVWIRTLEEGANSLNPAQMRQLLASILIFGNTENCVLDGAMLWNRFLQHMYDARCRESDRPGRIDQALALLEKLLVAQGKQCSDFGLPTPINSIVNDPDRGVNDFFFPDHIAHEERDETVDTSLFERTKLNAEQQNFFNRIRDIAGTMPNNSANRLFFLSGDGGAGKTFLLNYVLYHMRRLRKKVIATASTGMASTRFYSGGTTVHSAFRFGINVEIGQLPAIPFDSYFGRRITEADIIIIDEITMLEKTILENIDKLCRTLTPRYAHLPFAGKIVILSGDWKQSLPVVTDSFGTAAQVSVCLQSSWLYQRFEKVKLVQNMRVISQDREFIEWLQKVGIGAFGDTVPVPKEWIVSTRSEMVDFVFDQGFQISSNDLLKRLMLATTNRIVDLNNTSILATFANDYTDYFSEDKPLEENLLDVNAADYDVTHINLLNPSGMPAHKIRLKEGSIIVLLINLNTSKSLCNGTRLIVKKLTANLIHAEAITGGSSRSGIVVAIPRITMIYKEKRPGTFGFERFQFPVRVAFTMTVTKAQGQTCEKLGIDFTEESFAHGQTYTAFSRATNSNAIRVYAPNKEIDSEGNVLIRNIVANGIRFD